MSLLDNLISYWKLDEESGTRFDAHGENHLTDNNTVGFAAGKLGNAADFERDNSEYLSRASNSTIQTGDIDFTVACWVKAESAPSAAENLTIAAKGALDAGAGDEWAVYWSGPFNRFRCFVANGLGSFGAVNADVLGVPQLGQWYFIVAWHDAAANTVNIQVNNGVVDSVAHAAGGHAGAKAMLLGWDGVRQHWDGLIDGFGFWKKKLTADERSQLWNGGAGDESWVSPTSASGVRLINAGILSGGML